MTHEQEWSKENIRNTINYLRNNWGVQTQELFGANKQQDPNIPRYNGTRVALEKPLEVSASTRSPIGQNLDALLALGNGVLVGLVSASDGEGNTYRYLSLYSGNPDASRATFITTVNNGEEILIGRDLFHGIGDPEEFRTVSGNHASLNVDSEGVLTVIDNDSTNGTTLFTVSEENDQDMPFDSKDIRSWAIDTPSVERQLRQVAHEKSVLKGTLGKFTLDK